MSEIEPSATLEKPNVSGLAEASKDRGWFQYLFWAMLGVNALILICVWPGPNGNKIVSIVYFTSLVTTVELIGATAGFRFGFAIWKWILAVILMIAIGGISCNACSSGSHELSAFMVFNFGIFLASSATAVLLRVFKGDLRKVGSKEAYGDGMQFGIRDIIILTTAVAVFVAIGQWVSKFEGMMVGPMLWAVFALGALMSFSLSATVWAMLGKQVTVLKLGGILLVSGLSFYAIFRFLSFGATYFFPLIALYSQLMFFLMAFSIRRFSTLAIMPSPSHRRILLLGVPVMLPWASSTPE